LTSNDNKEQAALDKHWHLAENEHEVLVADLELAVMRISAALDRWQKDCISCEIARLMNRDDISNLQYSLRKLLNGGLIERSGKKDSKRNASYIVTTKGRQITDKFAHVRKEILLSLTGSIKDLDKDLTVTCKALNLVSGLYDHAAAVAATHQRG
jgi:predicted MarR family transcription regulator